jgi:hypothetical protein
MTELFQAFNNRQFCPEILRYGNIQNKAYNYPDFPPAPIQGGRTRLNWALVPMDQGLAEAAEAAEQGTREEGSCARNQSCVGIYCVNP